MFCVYCGAEISDDDIFCPTCGNRQDVSVDGAVAQDSSQAAAGDPDSLTTQIPSQAANGIPNSATTQLPAYVPSANQTHQQGAYDSGASQIQDYSQYSYSQPSAKKGGNTTLMALVCVVLVVAVGAGVAIGTHAMGLWGDDGASASAVATSTTSHSSASSYGSSISERTTVGSQSQNTAGSSTSAYSSGTSTSSASTSSSGSGGSSSGIGSSSGAASSHYISSTTTATISISGVSATSTLPTDDVNTASYSPLNLIDGDVTSCWCEGSSLDGSGESVTFTFKEKAKISGFKINNGYQVSEDLYQANARPKKVTIIADGDMVVGDFVIADSGLVQQRFTFDTAVEADTITLEIVNVYDGSRHDDCCISEMSFY